MLTPEYKLTFGSKVIDTSDEPQASTMVDLTITLDMDAPADSFTLLLGQVDGLQPQRDDEARIELGYAENGGTARVMSGTVQTVEPGLVTSRIIGHSTAAALLKSFADETFQNKKAGQVVRDLAGRASVDVASAEDGIEFPAYVIDGQRSFHHHMHDLAGLCGFDLYIDPDGELVFEKFAFSGTIPVFEYAKHVLELQVEDSPPRAGSVEAFGESPGSSRGEESWAWLSKDFSGLKGSAGSGDPKLLLERPVLRTSQAARTAALAAQTAIQRRTRRGRLLIQGSPEVKLGGAIRLRDVPDEELNATYQVRRVNHRITKAAGFTTEIGFRSL